MTNLKQIHDDLMAIVQDYRMGTLDVAQAIRRLREVQIKGLDLGVPIMIEDVERWLIDKAVASTVVSEASDASYFYDFEASSSSDFFDED